MKIGNVVTSWPWTIVGFGLLVGGLYFMNKKREEREIKKKVCDAFANVLDIYKSVPMEL